MPPAQLFFTPLRNSFKVYVQNLEELRVEQIVQLQEFVTQRHGVFDFTTYTFVIQKRLCYEQFVKLMKELKIACECHEVVVEEVVQPRVGFGQYKGLLYSELPDSYLQWLKNNYRGGEKSFIDAEFQKRKL